MNAHAVEDFVQDQGRIFHRREGCRTVTIAYRMNGNTLEYGATIHRRDSNSDNWNRRLHNQTAVMRCLNNPIRIERFGEHEYEHVSHKEDAVREAMFENGCWDTSKGGPFGVI